MENKNTYLILLLLFFLWMFNKDKKVGGAISDATGGLDPRIPCWRWADGSSYLDGFDNSPPIVYAHPELLGDWRMYYYCCDDFTVCAESSTCYYNIGFYWVANSRPRHQLSKIIISANYFSVDYTII